MLSETTPNAGLGRLRQSIGPIVGAMALVGVIALAFLPGCRRPPIWEKIPGGDTKVLVSFPPLYCFTTSVAGEHAKVHSLLTSQGVHGYEPTADKALLAREADIFFYNGLDLDDFVTRIANSSGNSKLVVDPVAAAIPKDQLLKMDEHDHGHAHGPGEHHHHHGEFDPHVWLGIPQAIAMVEQISATLQKVDKVHAADYADRAKKYIQELKDLEQYGKDKLAGKNLKLVTMHEALGYFAKSFGVEVVGSIQPSPNVAPDQRTMARLVELCKKHDVRLIAVEPQYAKGAAKTLQTELATRGVDAVLVEIDPFETAEPIHLNSGLYIKVMKQNIDSLAEKLP